MAPEKASDALLQLATAELHNMWRVILDVRNRIQNPREGAEVKLENGKVKDEFADLLVNAGKMQSMAYLNKQNELIGRSAYFLETFAKAPLLLLTGKFDEHSAVDVAVFEDLAAFLSYLAGFIEDPISKTPKVPIIFDMLSDSGENVVSKISALHTLGCKVLAGAEERCVPPKLGMIMPLMYADGDFWAGIINAEASKEFVLENKAITELMCSETWVILIFTTKCCRHLGASLAQAFRGWFAYAGGYGPPARRGVQSQDEVCRDCCV